MDADILRFPVQDPNNFAIPTAVPRRRAESPWAAIRVLRNFIATLRAEGVTTIEVDDLERAVDRAERNTR